MKNDIFVHSFTDGSGIAIFDARVQEARTINCSVRDIVEINRKNTSDLTESELKLLGTLRELSII